MKLQAKKQVFCGRKKGRIDVGRDRRKARANPPDFDVDQFIRFFTSKLRKFRHRGRWYVGRAVRCVVLHPTKGYRKRFVKYACVRPYIEKKTV